MRLQAHLRDIRGACCPRRWRCGACRPPRAHRLSHVYAQFAYAHSQLPDEMHTTTHRNRISAASAEPAACGLFYVFAEPALRGAQARTCVFACCAARKPVGAAHLHAYISAEGPGLASGPVLCVRRRGSKDVLNVFCQKDSSRIQRLGTAYSCVQPVNCIRESHECHKQPCRRVHETCRLPVQRQ